VIETLLAALVLIVCLVMLGRMMLPARQQERFDALLRDWRDRLGALRHRRPWQRRASRQDAARTAEEAIRKARRAASRRPNGSNGSHAGHGHDADKPEPEGEWDGNVFRPKSFKPPQKPH
jgi:hypothetical protein